MRWYSILGLAVSFFLGWQANNLSVVLSEFLPQYASPAQGQLKSNDPTLDTSFASSSANSTYHEASGDTPEMLFNVLSAFKQALSRGEFATSVDHYDLMLFERQYAAEADEYLFELVSNLAKTGRGDEALMLMQIYADYYQNSKFIYPLAQLMFQQGDFMPAIESLYQLKGEADGAVARKLSKDIITWVDAAIAEYDLKNKLVLKQELLWQLEALDPTEGRYVLMLAQLHEKSNALDEARDAYSRLLLFEDYEDEAATKLRLLDEKLQALAAGEITIPLNRIGKHYSVSAYINNEVKTELLLDTGASLTVIKASLLSSADLGTGRELTFNTANGMTKGEVHRVNAFQIDEVQIRNFDIAVLSMPDMKSADGLLGMNFFEQFEFRIDQSANALILKPKVD